MKIKRFLLISSIVVVSFLFLCSIAPYFLGQIIQAKFIASVEHANKMYVALDNKASIKIKEYKRQWFSSEALLEIVWNETTSEMSMDGIQVNIQEKIVHGPMLFDRETKTLEFLLSKINSKLSFVSNNKKFKIDQNDHQFSTRIHYNGQGKWNADLPKLSGSVYHHAKNQNVPIEVAFEIKDIKTQGTIDFLNLSNSKINILMREIFIGNNIYNFKINDLLLDESFEKSKNPLTNQIEDFINSNASLKSMAVHLDGKKSFSMQDAKFSISLHDHFHHEIQNKTQNEMQNKAEKLPKMECRGGYASAKVHDIELGPTEFDFSIQNLELKNLSAALLSFEKSYQASHQGNDNETGRGNEKINTKVNTKINASVNANENIQRNGETNTTGAANTKNSDKVISPDLAVLLYEQRSNKNQNVFCEIKNLKTQLMGSELAVRGSTDLVSNKNAKVEIIAKAEIDFGPNIVPFFTGVLTGQQIQNSNLIVGYLKENFALELDDRYKIFVLYRNGKSYVTGRDLDDSLGFVPLPSFKSPLNKNQEFFFSIWSDNFEKFSALLNEKVDLEFCLSDGKTPLIMASYLGNRKMVNAILAEQVHIHQKDAIGGTALYWAARKGHIDIVNDLLSKGANPDEPNKDGWTPLQEAAEHGRIEVAQLLLERKSAINLTDRKGLTALHWAAVTGKEDMVKFLLQHGADSSLRDVHGRTALDLARQEKRDKVVELLNQKDL